MGSALRGGLGQQPRRTARKSLGLGHRCQSHCWSIARLRLNLQGWGLEAPHAPVRPPCPAAPRRAFRVLTLLGEQVTAARGWHPGPASTERRRVLSTRVRGRLSDEQCSPSARWAPGHAVPGTETGIPRVSQTQSPISLPPTLGLAVEGATPPAPLSRLCPSYCQRAPRPRGPPPQGGSPRQPSPGHRLLPPPPSWPAVGTGPADGRKEAALPCFLLVPPVKV